MEKKELISFLQSLIYRLELAKADKSGHQLSVYELTIKEQLKRLQNDTTS